MRENVVHDRDESRDEVVHLEDGVVPDATRVDLMNPDVLVHLQEEGPHRPRYEIAFPRNITAPTSFRF